MKETLRRELLQARQETSDKAKRSAQISKNLIDSLKQEYKTVATYAAFRSEASPADAVRYFQENGVRVLFPSVCQNGLEFREARPEDLVRGSLGVKEPGAGHPLFAPADIDVVVVPGLAFTRAGDRLGYGGGYYDRFLAEYRARRNNGLVIGFGFAAQVVESLPRERWDQPVDAIVTETELHYAEPRSALR